MGAEKKKIIELKNVSKVFESKSAEVQALNDINLTIMKGEIFGIVGPSGAGKSTLVRLINLLERPSSGEVRVGGEELTCLSEAQLREKRKSIGMIFQGFNLLMQKTVLQNVVFPLKLSKVPKEEGEARARELLKLVGLKDKVDAYPAELSGGQKQRVAIARALAIKPKVILLDEATSALDPQTTRDILRLIKEINISMQVTVIVITHEMHVVEEICDRVAILDGGRIAEEGEVRHVFSNPKSKAGKKLVFPEGISDDFIPDTRLLRLAFIGDTTTSPLISSLSIETGVRVNILAADTRNLDGMAFGTMLIELPQDKNEADKVVEYLKMIENVTVEEVKKNG